MKIMQITENNYIIIKTSQNRTHANKKFEVLKVNNKIFNLVLRI